MTIFLSNAQVLRITNQSIPNNSLLRWSSSMFPSDMGVTSDGPLLVVPSNSCVWHSLLLARPPLPQTPVTWTLSNTVPLHHGLSDGLPLTGPTPMVIFIGKYSVEIAQFFIIVFSLQLLIIVMSIIYLGTCIFSQTAQLFTWMHAMAIATHIVILSACICTWFWGI